MYSAGTAIMAFVQPPSDAQDRARPQEPRFLPRKRSLRPSLTSTAPPRPSEGPRRAGVTWRASLRRRVLSPEEARAG